MNHINTFLLSNVAKFLCLIVFRLYAFLHDRPVKGIDKTIQAIVPKEKSVYFFISDRFLMNPTIFSAKHKSVH